jgi:hypothetical protein
MTDMIVRSATGTTHFAWCDETTEHDPADGGTWHQRQVGVIPTRCNDLADADEPRRDAPFAVTLMARDGDEHQVAVLSVDGWAEAADLSLEDARRARDVLTAAVELMEHAESTLCAVPTEVIGGAS